MSFVKIIEGPIKEELLKFKKYHKNSLKSETRILDIISSFVHYQKKNDSIPLITLLSAKISGEITENTLVAASLIDLLYTATLIHDDVQEENFDKKLFSRINDLWKTKLSVLMGDYFLAKGLLLSVKNKTYNLLEIASKSVKEMTEGELQIIYNSRELFINQKNYLEIITKKTASLYSACAMAGAVSAGGNKESIYTLNSFGQNYGLALHISSELNYKSTIKNSKYRITLPLILSLEKVSEAERKKMLNYLQFPINKELTKFIHNFTEKKGGIDDARIIMEDYKTKALDDISEFPYSNIVESFKKMIQLHIN